VLISGNRKFRPQNSIIQFVQVNGQPGLASYLNGRVETIITVDVVNSQIRNVYILRNPDKLQNTPSLPS
jgi:RNA polymerase sigma-70 factor (ECF subfamily)